jgi:hypothetical protein
MEEEKKAKITSPYCAGLCRVFWKWGGEMLISMGIRAKLEQQKIQPL